GGRRARGASYVPGLWDRLRRERRDVATAAIACLVRDRDRYLTRVAPLAEARGHARGEIEIVVGSGSIDQYQRTGVARRLQMCIAVAKAEEKVRFAFVARHDQFEMW